MTEQLRISSRRLTLAAEDVIRIKQDAGFTGPRLMIWDLTAHKWVEVLLAEGLWQLSHAKPSIVLPHGPVQ